MVQKQHCIQHSMCSDAKPDALNMHHLTPAALSPCLTYLHADDQAQQYSMAAPKASSKVEYLAAEVP